LNENDIVLKEFEKKNGIKLGTVNEKIKLDSWNKVMLPRNFTSK